MNKKTKKWLVIAASLVVGGCILFGGVMTMAKWDFMKLSTIQHETNEHVIRDDYKNISIVTDTADIVFLPSEHSETTVVCREQKKVNHTVTVKDNTLVIEVEDTRKWYEYLNIGFGASSITVYLPQGEYGALSVKASTGDIQLENLSVEKLDLSVSTGKTNLTDITCKNLTSSGNTGDISLKQVIAAEKFSIKRSTGDVKFDGCDAAEILAQTDTGDVTGSLLTDKVFITETSTGKIDVPRTTTGGRCEITTSTGDIKIEISHS